MRKVNGFFAGLALILCLVLVFASCNGDSDNDNNDDSGADNTIVYKSDKGDTSYVLEITKNPKKAAFTPEAGDLYKLTITKKGGTPQVSTGTVESYSGGEFTFRHNNGSTFTVKGTDDGLMTEIKGNIPIDGSDDKTEQAPGVVDVNMVGTTWKADGGTMDGQVIKGTCTATFGQSTVTVVNDWEGGGEYNTTYTGTYTVKGTTITASGAKYGNGTYEVVNGNTIHAVFPVDGRTLSITLIKQ